jgi:hypothetical protein
MGERGGGNGSGENQKVVRVCACVCGIVLLTWAGGTWKKLGLLASVVMGPGLLQSIYSHPLGSNTYSVQSSTTPNLRPVLEELAQGS